MVNKFCDSYAQSLLGNDLERYESKIRLCGGEDPYEVRWKDLSDDINVLPCVTLIDVYNYLVWTTNSITMKQFKAYKSLEAHNFFTSGWVNAIRQKKLTDGKNLIFGKVNHSQSIRETPVKAWILADSDGELLTAHCSCMAGCSETCSHVGAILFAVEYGVRCRDSLACTSKSNSWLPPVVREVPYSEVRAYDFSSSAAKRKKMSSTNVSPSAVVAPVPAVDRTSGKLSGDRLRKFLEDVESTDPYSALLRVVPPFCDKLIPEKPDIPPTFSSFYNPAVSNLTLNQLQNHCEDVFGSLTISEDIARAVEEATKGQSNCSTWMEQRMGRVTASKMKAVCHSNPFRPSVSLLKTICYPQQHQFFSQATEWGKKHEKIAFQKYGDFMKKNHECFEVRTCGLFIKPQYPHIAASPDGVVKCSCHGDGIVEIKCPFSANSTSGVCADGSLDKKHEYFYQVQAQLLVSNAQYCDFVVWRQESLTVVRILPDKDFQAAMVAKATAFFKLAILPEIVGRFYSAMKHTELRPENNEHPFLVCFCQRPPERPMITCSGKNCTFITFHCKCLNIRNPRKNWLCPECS